MMTLDEAIKHCNEVACKHDKCSTEHKQLAQWLTELKSYRVSATQEAEKTTDNSELKELEDEKIRKVIIEYIKTGTYHKNWITWLEKQEPIDKDKLAKGVLRSVATTIMQYLDANKTEGKMCLSNMECEDIENAVLNADWAKVYRYMKKKLEKQDNKKVYTFKSIPRLLDMIEPTSKVKAYCQKLIDTLVKEGYATDAKIVSDCLKQMNGEKVAMATMDEKQDEQQDK